MDEDLVWHYTDGAGLISIVTNHVLWATHSGFLNDADEVALGGRLIQEAAARRLAAGDEFAGWLSAEMERRRDDDAPDEFSPTAFFILSAAQHWDLLAMWRLYGGAGESYAIGLDASAPLAVLVDEGVDQASLDAGGRYVRHRPWSPVRYDEAEQRALADAVMDGMPEELGAMRERFADGPPSRQEILDASHETREDLEQALMLIKHSGFADERETRHCTLLLDVDGDPNWPGVVRYRPTAYGIAPHLHLTGGDGAAVTDHPAPLPIRSVALSPSGNGGAATASVRALLAAHGYAVDVRRSGVPFRG